MLIDPNYPLIVHSHLRWDWVWQRPQQFLSRFTLRHRILFVEGPRLFEEEGAPYATLQQDERFPNLTIMHTHFPAARFGDGEWVDAERRRLLCEALAGPLQGQFDNPVQWFYDPMAAPAFIGKIGEVANVYDCMDQLSQFKFAPPELIEREQILLKAADVVFAGGRKMWEDKRRTNPNSHFYGCGVDVEHFGKARSPELELPADVADLPRPIFGYFGVVDERMDYELFAKMADANPEGSVAVIGPTCKVDPAELPQRPNLHWLGGRDYAQLPAYTAAFDVCLMPFALNEATEYINPTKALEYMATGRPIVSTPVPDVVSNFSEVVDISGSHEEFLELCRLAATEPDKSAIKKGLQMANDNTWDAIVGKLEGHIMDALVAKAGFTSATVDASATAQLNRNGLSKVTPQQVRTTVPSFRRDSASSVASPVAV
jgi:glycosyltransferase involved in cell wall biosynthesis